MPHIHNCYFHQQHQITHFCTKLHCTLPMCSKCLPIHIEQHQGDKNEGIVSFAQAQLNAIDTLKKMLDKQSKIREDTFKKMDETKTKFIKEIDQFFAFFRNKIDQQFNAVGQIQKKLTKIQKGSLKTLIYFYSEQQKTINQNLIHQIVQKTQNAFNLCRNTIQVSKKVQIRSHQNAIEGIQLKALNKQNQQVHQISQTKPYERTQRQRGHSIDVYPGLNRRIQNAKSTTQLRAQHHNRMIFTGRNDQAVEQRLSNNRSLKILHKNQLETHKNYQIQLLNRIKEDRVQIDSKNDIESERQKQIQRIRKREQERQRQKMAKLEKQKIQKQIQRQKSRQKQRQKERSRQRQRYQRQCLMKQQTRQMLQKQSNETVNQYKVQRQMQRYTVKNEQFGSYENRTYAMAEYKQISTKLQPEKRPLEIADLNVNSNIGGETENKIGVYKYSYSREFQGNSHAPSNTLLENNISKEVLSPEQIRKMLEKRIQERSRLISKNRTLTPSKSVGKFDISGDGHLKSKFKENEGNFMDGEARWDTKDSIINQIYEDYRN